MRRMSIWGVLALAACTGGGSDTPDAGGPSGDAGMHQGDAALPTLTDDVDGTWRFDLGPADGPDHVACDVTVSLGWFEVVCPDPAGPTVIGPDCMRTQADTRISGELPDGLVGQVDTIEQYDGTGCAAAGYPSGIPVVSSGVAWLWAERGTVENSGGFWSVVDGSWSFELDWAVDPQNQYIQCSAALTGGAFDITCPQTSGVEVVPGCSEDSNVRLTGRVGLDGLMGQLYGERTRQGTGCEPAGLPLYEMTAPVPFSATR